MYSTAAIAVEIPIIINGLKYLIIVCK
jgi:hypothetical protein